MMRKYGDNLKSKEDYFNGQLASQEKHSLGLKGGGELCSGREQECLETDARRWELTGTTADADMHCECVEDERVCHHKGEWLSSIRGGRGLSLRQHLVSACTALSGGQRWGYDITIS